MARAEPLARGSVSLRLYPHLDRGGQPDEPQAIIGELLAQGRLADQCGFDGVMVSEHHNAFAGYLPNPLQVAGWLLDAMPTAWAAACPLLLTLRPSALVAEETAWLSARFPGRVGLGVAAGALDDDFTIMGLTKERLTERFADGLAAVSGMLLGRDPGPLANDPAIQHCATHPVAVVSAAASATAARRAARAGVGLLLDSLTGPERCRALVDAYRAGGGSGTVVLIRRVWVGDPPAVAHEQQVAVYRGYAPARATGYWQGQQMVTGDDERSVAAALKAVAASVGANALNLRIHVPGVSPAAVRQQIQALAGVLARLA